MLQESLKVARTNGFEAVQCMALSYYTQKICFKHNFEELYSIKYGDYLQNGQLLFDAEKMGEHQKGVFFARKL